MSIFFLYYILWIFDSLFIMVRFRCMYRSSILVSLQLVTWSQRLTLRQGTRDLKRHLESLSHFIITTNTETALWGVTTIIAWICCKRTQEIRFYVRFRPLIRSRKHTTPFERNLRGHPSGKRPGGTLALTGSRFRGFAALQKRLSNSKVRIMTSAVDPLNRR